MQKKTNTKTYKNISWDSSNETIEGTPLSEIPKEILDYYAKHGYWKRNIPFSTDTFRHIAKIIESGEEEEKTSDYDENMTFDKLTPFPHYPLW